MVRFWIHPREKCCEKNYVMEVSIAAHRAMRKEWNDLVYTKC